jgi:hypothetical protein
MLLTEVHVSGKLELETDLQKLEIIWLIMQSTAAVSYENLQT